MLQSLYSQIPGAQHAIDLVVAAIGRNEIAAASAPSSAPTASFGTRPLNSNLSIFIVEIVIIIVVAKVLTWLLAKVKQPAVIAEVITGVLLGPTVMGRVSGFQSTIFPPANMAIFSTFAEVGLVLFMNLVGLELDFALMSREWKSTAVISVVGIALPMAVSVGSSYAVWDAIDRAYPSEKNKTFGTYVLFMAVAMSVTAFPVLARIVKEKQLLKTRIGRTTLAVAAWDDVAAWILLALSVSLVTGGGKFDALWTLLLLIGYASIMLIGVRPLLRKFLLNRHGEPRKVSNFVFAAYLVCTFGNAWLTEYFGLHSIFGAFIWGLVVPREKGFTSSLAEKFEELSTTFFLPLYFTASGLRTQLGLLKDGNTWGLLLLVTSIAIITKVSGGCFAAKLSGMTWRESFTLGILMNTKGLVELIVLNIGLDNKLISPTTFSMMIVMALVTTFLTSPFVHYLYPYDRIVEFENQTPGKITLFLKTTSRSEVPAILGVVSLIVKGRPKKYKTIAAHATSFSDRTVTYSGDQQVDEVLQHLQDTGQILGVKIKSSDVMIDIDSEQDMVSQLTTLSTAKNADFVFSVWRPSLPSARSSTSDLHGSASLLRYESLGGDSSAVSRIYNHPGFRSNTVVLLDRGMKSTEHSIMFVYGGTVHDKEATKLIRAMLHNPIVDMEVVVVFDTMVATASLPTREQLLERDAILKSLFNATRPGTVSLTLLHGVNANISLINHINESNAGLVVFGSDLCWNLATTEGVIHQEIAMATAKSMLFVAKCKHNLQKGDGDERISMDDSSIADTIRHDPSIAIDDQQQQAYPAESDSDDSASTLPSHLPSS